MNRYPEENSCCFFHPKEVIVGICALCLKERLLALAEAKQGQRQRALTLRRKAAAISLHRVFALGSFLRHESHPKRPKDVLEGGSMTSLEDSFISIKFEDNGHGLWDNKRLTVNIEPSKPIGGGGPNSNEGVSKEIIGKSVVEHTKLRGTLRWRKKIGQLLQLARWKSANGAGACHVGLAGKGEKGRRGWIRSLTQRRTTSTID